MCLYSLNPKLSLNPAKICIILSLSLTHHSSSVSLHKLDDASRVLVPQVDVSTVTATDHKLTGWPIEVHPLHCEKEDERG